MPKTHEDFWKPRLRRRSYRNATGKVVEVPEWQIKLSRDGRQRWINLQTANKTTAARKARDAWIALTTIGWDAVKPPREKIANPTIGEFLDAVRAESDLAPATFEIYAQKLRRLVSGVFGIRAGKGKYDHASGTPSKWRARVNAVRFSRLTSRAIQRWKTQYIVASGNSPIKERRAKRTVGSILRCCKALFAPKVIARLDLALPHPLPLDAIDVPRVTVSHYVSRVEPEILYRQAQRELESPSDEMLRTVVCSPERRKKARVSAKRPLTGLAEERRVLRAIERERVLRRDMFRIFCLALFAGLRRDEIDTLLWRQIDFAGHTIRIETNEHTSAKSDRSEECVDIDPAFSELIRAWMKESTSEFVLTTGGKPRPEIRSYHHYRCADAFKWLLPWLRTHGLGENMALHALRKEFGTQINLTHGLFAASAALRHTSIQLTRAVYVAKKARAVFALPGAAPQGEPVSHSPNTMEAIS